MTMKINNRQKGFTIIEVVIAMFVLMVGVLGTVIMQDAFIKGNSTAIHLTGDTNSASDQMETLMGFSYGDDELSDANNTPAANEGVTGLNNTDVVGSEADGYEDQGDREVFWNVANDYPIFGAKTIRVVVRRKDGVHKDVVIDFIKMRPI